VIFLFLTLVYIGSNFLQANSIMRAFIMLARGEIEQRLTYMIRYILKLHICLVWGDRNAD